MTESTHGSNFHVSRRQPTRFLLRGSETLNWSGREREIKKKNETEDTIYKDRPGIRHVSTIRAPVYPFLLSPPLPRRRGSCSRVSTYPGLRRRRRNKKDRSAEKTKKRRSRRRRETEAVRMRDAHQHSRWPGPREGFAAARFYCIFTTLRRQAKASISYPRHTLTRASPFLPPNLRLFFARLLRAIKAPRNRPSSSETAQP